MTRDEGVSSERADALGFTVPAGGRYELSPMRWKLPLLVTPLLVTPLLLLASFAAEPAPGSAPAPPSTSASAPAPASDAAAPGRPSTAPSTAPSEETEPDRAPSMPPPPKDLPIEPADPVPLLSAEEAIRTMKLPPGLRVEVVATEPLIEHPVAMSFDPDGRLWVVEMRAYMPNVEGTGEDAPTGRVSVLDDLDGDGRMDRATVFLDRLVLPRAVSYVRGGVLVAVPPKVLFCQDTDGDGKSDKQTVIATDYGLSGNPEHQPNGLMPALDNWIYSADYDKRFRYVGGQWTSELVPEVGQWGISQDDHGRLFHNNNSDHLRASPVPVHYTNRNPHYRASGANEPTLKDQATWPAHKTAINRGYLERFIRSDGVLKIFTAACGPVIYRGNALPAEYRGNAFACEPSGNLIRRSVLTDRPDGGIAGRNPHPRDEFLTSTYERFRPVNLYNGPDGALYVLDMHHGLIQHKTYLTTYAREQYLQRDLHKHLMTGRIYRIVADNAGGASAGTTQATSRPAASDGATTRPTTRPKPPRLGAVTTADLVALLGHANGWTRDTAQRLLVERGDYKAIPMLRKLAATSADPLARLHALWTLEGFGVNDPATILPALADKEPKLRAAAIRLAEPLLSAPAARARALPAVMKLADDPHPSVRLQFALSMSNQGTPQTEPVLARLLGDDATSDYLRDAVISGLRGRELEFLDRLLALPAFTLEQPGRAALLTALARCVLAESNPKRVSRMLDLIAQEPGARTMPWPTTASASAAAAVPAPATRIIGALAATTVPASAPASAPATMAIFPPEAWRQVAMLEAFPERPTSRNRRPPRPIRLESEPPALAKLSASATTRPASEYVERVLSMVVWPGKPGYVPPPPPPPLTPEQRSRFEAGRVVYAKTCAQCHKPNGLGQEGLAPPLVDSEWVLGPESRLVPIVLHGVSGPISVSGRTWIMEMPGLSALKDEEVAAVLTYVRREWDHAAPPVNPDTVARVRRAAGNRAMPWTERELMQMK